MKKLRLFLIVITGISLAGFVAWRIWFHNPYSDKLRLDAQKVFAEDNTAYSLLIRNATLIDVEDGRPIPNTNLFIQGDTIADIFVDEEPLVPEGTKEYDASGKFIMPGLTDLHVHLATYWHLASGDFSTEDSLVTKATLEQLVRYGVTTILVLGGGGANNEQVVELKRQEQRNSIIAPKLFAVGNLITVPGSHPITTIMRLPKDTSPERLHQAGVTVVDEDIDIVPIIKHKKQLGLDGIKIILEEGPEPFYPNPRMSVQTAGKIIKQAEKHDLPVYAHAEFFKEFRDAVRLGVHAIMHSVSDTLIHDLSLIERMKQEDIWYTPTLSLFYGFQFLDHPERIEDDFLQAGVSKRAIRSLEHPLFRLGFGSSIGEYNISKWLETSMQNLVLLHQEGVGIALGTDASTPFNFPGYSVHTEMELMSRAGLSNAEVLRIATFNGARFLGIEDKVGSIETGKIANMILLDENPLADIRNTQSIRNVILKGRLIDPGYQYEAPTQTKPTQKLTGEKND